MQWQLPPSFGLGGEVPKATRDLQQLTSRLRVRHGAGISSHGSRARRDLGNSSVEVAEFWEKVLMQVTLVTSLYLQYKSNIWISINVYIYIVIIYI